MRHIRTRRRLKTVLVLLLLLSITLFAEARIESLAPSLKDLAEIKVEEAFGNRFQVSIGKIEGGILHPLTLDDCSVKERNRRTFLESIDIESIRSDYRVWDFFKKNNAVKWLDKRFNIFFGKPSIDVNFETKAKDLEGFLRLEGDTAAPDFKGYLSFPGKNKFDFTGHAEKENFNIEIKEDRSILKVTGALDDSGNLNADIKASHVRILGQDIVCDAVLKSNISEDAASHAVALEGEFQASNVYLNYKPFFDIRASYKFSDGTLYISNLEFGNDIRLNGKVLLKRPYNIDVVITADNTNFNQILSMLGVKDSGSILTGTLNGRFALKGTFEKLKSDIKIDMRKGTIAGSDFENLSAAFKGDGPIIRIEDSRITRQSGSLTLTGELDMRKIGKNNFFNDIKLITDGGAISWDGINTTNRLGVDEVLMKKKMTEEVDLGFKRFVDNKSIDESLKGSDEVQVEYKLHSNDSLKMMLGQNKDFFGVEHKDKF